MSTDADTQALVIGSGADELVAAHYLARAGLRVRVLRESRSPGAPLRTGWIPPAIVRELALEQKGLAVQHPDPWAIAPLPGGGRLALTRDVTRSAEAIRAVSARDAQRWPEFCRRMHALAAVLEHFYGAPPPDPLTHELGGYLALARDALRVRKLGRQGIEDLLRLMPMPAADLLDEWFESDVLKGVLGAAGVMHLSQGPRSGGTAFNFLHHHVGSPPGVFRQPLSNVDRVLGEVADVGIQDGRVARIQLRKGYVTGVVLDSGEEIAASLVLSGVDVKRTLLELVDPVWLDPALVRAVRNIRSRGVVAQVALTLDADLGFTTLVAAPSLDYLERAYDHAKHGRVSSEPYIEARHVGPDETGRHIVEVHVQYVPHALAEGSWDTAASMRLARLAIDRLTTHVPGFASLVIEQHTATPYDLAHIHGFPQGQAYHAELALDQALWMRPVPQLSRYRTPIEGLYLCGPAMHPGGGIIGAAGVHAARIVLGDLQKRKK